MPTDDDTRIVSWDLQMPDRKGTITGPEWMIDLIDLVWMKLALEGSLPILCPERK